MADTEQTNLTKLTADLLGAYFATNTVDSAQLPGLIKSTHEALKAIDSPEPEAPAPEEYAPAVTMRKSLASKDHIISLIDGKAYKTLKRHLSTNNLTPAEYRARYKLPANYPMVAPGYSEQRRAVAERLGLGRKPAGAPSGSTEPVAQPAEAAAPALANGKPKPAAPSAAKAAAKPKAVKAATAEPKIAKPAKPAKPKSAPPAQPSASDAKPEQVADAPAPAKTSRGRKTPVAKAAAKAPAQPATAKRAPRKPKTTPTPDGASEAS